MLGLSDRHCRRIVDWLARSHSIAADQVARARSLAVEIITRDDATYPTPLLDLDLPPPVLYCRGNLPTSPAIAIVGSRCATSTNRAIARMFACGLANSGLTVVSGFARGIDQAAHQGALAATGGTTIAALGCGIDLDYPAGSRPLASRIASNGAVITEFPIGASPIRPNFPIRNRLIAALSSGTLVVQATIRSGSLITARLALDLGRDVYAIPGPIGDPAAAGPNGLIRDGAFLVQSPGEIVETLSTATQLELSLATARLSDGASESASDELLANMPLGRPVSVEQLAVDTGVALDSIFKRLLELELQGQVQRCPGPLYLRTA